MKLKESKLRRIIRQVISEKRFHELPQYAKNQETEIYRDLQDEENADLRDEIFSLIDQSYAYIGGNADIRSAADLADPGSNDYVLFKAWDIDEDPEADVVRGMKPKAGKIKLALSATDGSGLAADFAVGDTAARLNSGQYYAEMSGRAATSQMKQGTPAVTDQATAAALLPGKTFTWFGQHPALYDGGDPDMQVIADMFQGKGSQIEAGKALQYGPNGEYNGWYVRSLGGAPHAKIIFGAV